MVRKIYDDPKFFKKYSEMSRSQKGLAGAGEWHELKKVLPDFQDKVVLDLGCGFGWHCFYAAENGAKQIIGVDISEKMLAVANEKNKFKQLSFMLANIETIDFERDRFDVVISSLAFHYLESFDVIAKKVRKYLKKNGKFIFSVEHPVFTAEGSQDWIYKNGEIDHFPVDHYFEEGARTAKFLGTEVVKYHKTMTSYLNGLLQNDFQIDQVIEPMPDQDMLAIPGMKDELRRPMMMIVAATNRK